MGQTLSSPEAWAASAAILHRLTAVIQLDSNRLHSSSLSLVCWGGNGSTIVAGLPLRCEKLQWSSADVPLCADCWWVAGMNLPLRRSFSPERLNTFSGRRCVHKQPVKEFRTDVSQIYFPSMRLSSPQFQKASLPLNSFQEHLQGRRWSVTGKCWNCQWPARLLLWSGRCETGFRPKMGKRGSQSNLY